MTHPIITQREPANKPHLNGVLPITQLQESFINIELRRLFDEPEQTPSFINKLEHWVTGSSPVGGAKYQSHLIRGAIIASVTYS